jgi:hypothetical protein
MKAKEKAKELIGNFRIYATSRADNDGYCEQTREEAKQEFYSQLPNYEKLYQMKNDEYKKLISGFSDAYLEICDFYVGPELPRETFFDSSESLNELYFMFLMSLFFIKK